MLVSVPPSPDQSALQLRGVSEAQLLLQSGFCRPTTGELLPKSYRTAAEHCCFTKHMRTLSQALQATLC